MIDLVAPTDLSFHLRPTGSFGEVEEDLTHPAGGTSSATPVISGLSLLVKPSYLARGLSFINNPGRLHTVMLAMGDRHFSASPANPLIATTPRVHGDLVKCVLFRPRTCPVARQTPATSSSTSRSGTC